MSDTITEEEDVAYEETIQRFAEQGIDLRHITELAQKLDKALMDELKDGGVSQIDALSALMIIVGSRYFSAFAEAKFGDEDAQVLEDVGVPEELRDPATAVATMAEELAAGFHTLEAELGPGGEHVLPLAAAKYITAAFLKKTVMEES